MKNSFMRFVLFVVLTIAVSVSMCTIVAAADNSAGETIRIKLGDELLSVDDTRLMEDGRTYAPYDVLFDAIGAQASYDEEYGIITGTLGDTTVVFTIDDWFVEINDEWYYIDAVPFQDSDTGVIYIPVRYTAQALGYVVGWDDATRSISLQTVEDLIAESGATYSVINEYLDYQKSFSEKNYEISGSFDMSLDISSIEDRAPLSIAGDVSGIVAGGNSEISLSMETNLSEFVGEYMYEDELDEQTLLMLSFLNDIDIDFILNSDEGMMYMQSPLLTLLLGLDADTWLSMDIGDYLSEISELEMMIPEKFEDILSVALKSVNISDTGGSTVEMLQVVNSVISDQAMVKDGDNYIASFLYEEEGEAVEAQIVFAYEGETFTGINVSINMAVDDVMSFSAAYVSDTTGANSFEMSFVMDNYMTVEVSADFTCTETDATPSSQPEEGSTIIPLEDLLVVLTEMF